MTLLYEWDIKQSSPSNLVPSSTSNGEKGENETAVKFPSVHIVYWYRVLSHNCDNFNLYNV